MMRIPRLFVVVFLSSILSCNVGAFTGIDHLGVSRKVRRHLQPSPLLVSTSSEALMSSIEDSTSSSSTAATSTVNGLSERMAVATTSAAAVQAQSRSNSNHQKMQMFFGGATAAAVVSFLMFQHFDNSVVAQTTVMAMFHHMTSIPLHAYDAYESVLASNPVATKAATSATVYSIGDIVAQYTEQRQQQDEQSMVLVDKSRVLRSMLAGGIGHGPLSHVWYHVSEDFFNNVAHLTTWWSFLPKIAVDQTVWGPIWNSLYILMIGLMRQESLEKMVGDIRSTTFPLFLDGLKLWPLAHCVTYGLVPVENRLLWVDAVEILWVSMLATKAASLAVPNEGTGEEKEIATAR